MQSADNKYIRLQSQQFFRNTYLNRNNEDGLRLRIPQSLLLSIISDVCVKTTIQIPPISVYFNTRVSYCTDWWSIDSKIDERWILFPGLFLVNWVRKIANTFLSYSPNCFWCLDLFAILNILKKLWNVIRFIWLQVFLFSMSTPLKVCQELQLAQANISKFYIFWRKKNHTKGVTWKLK